jgi:hypothetical protein
VLPPQAPQKEVLLGNMVLLRPQLQVSCACDVMYIASLHAGASAASSSSTKGGDAATAAGGGLLLGLRFNCSSSKDAKHYLLEHFGLAHPFGQPHCRNSSAIKVLVVCIKCKSGATIGGIDSKTWVVRHLRKGACAPCPGTAAQGALSAAAAADLPWECGMNHDTTLRAVVCLNPNPHRLCVECFENLAAHRMIGEERASFIGSGAQINCPLCTEGFGFDMRLCASALSAETYELYMACTSEVEVIKTQKEFEARLQRMTALAAASAGGPESECTSLRFDCSLILLCSGPYIEHIAVHLILPRCPTPTCRRQIFDFEGCTALQCGRDSFVAVQLLGTGCGAHYCAWCMTICESSALCHSHVARCPFNPCPS